MSRITDNKTVGMIGRILNENAPTLAIGGAIGTLVGALYAAFKASQEVSAVKEKYNQKVEEIASEAVSEAEKTVKMKEAKSERNVKYVMAYKWAGLCGAASIALMITSNALKGAKIAGLTTIAVAYQDKLKKVAENGKKMLGDEPWKQVEDQTLEDMISKNFFGEDGPYARKLSPREGRLFIDTDSAFIFQINESDLKDVLIHAKEYYQNHGKELSQEKFFEMLGFIDIPPGAREKYWGPNNEFEAWIGERKYLGATFPSIEFKHPSALASTAGLKGARA